MVILGIDPGTATTGYGLVKVAHGARNGVSHLEHGIFATPKSKLPHERLFLLERQLAAVLKKYKPRLVAVERLYFFKNVKSALPVSEARGVVLLLAAQRRLRVAELTPLQVKMAITGYGKAQKHQVQRMVQEFLGLKDLPRPDDAADALGLAIASSVLTLHHSDHGEGLTRKLK